MSRVARGAEILLGDLDEFSRSVLMRPLRRYQLEPLEAIFDSVIRMRGLEFLLIFPRQSGKNEAVAQLLVFLLNIFQRIGGNIVYGATGDCLGLGSRRLEIHLDNPLNRSAWTKTAKPTRHLLHKASVTFLSTYPQAAVRGHTAHHLLVIDETQDQPAGHIEAVFTPMRAANNATALYIGTVKHTSDYLWQKKLELEREQRDDGIQRVFLVDAAQVIAENPAYKRFLDAQVRKFGRLHPIVASEYFLEPIDASGGLFDQRRRALMRGDHARQTRPQPGRLYVATLDVAGEDEAATDPIARLARPGRDYTVATLFEVLYPPPWSEAPAPGASATGRGALSTVGGPEAFALGASATGSGALSTAGGPEAFALGASATGSGALSTAGGPEAYALGASATGSGALSTAGGLYAPGPTFRAVDVFVDHGSKHFQDHPGRPALVQRLLAWLQHWRIAHLICDESGVGLGVTSWLVAALGPYRVTGYNFAGTGNKARLGSMFLSLIETGRFKYWTDVQTPGSGVSSDGCGLSAVEQAEFRAPGDSADGIGRAALSGLSDAAWFWAQVQACTYEIPPEGRFDRDLRWEVPPSHRTDTPQGPQSTHDDRLLSAALVAQLDHLLRTGDLVLGAAESATILAADPLAGMGEVY